MSALLNETHVTRRCICGRTIFDGGLRCEKCHELQIERANERYRSPDEIAADAAGVSPWGPL